MSIRRIDSNGRRSRAVVHGETIYLAGQVADDRSGDIVAQTSATLAKIDTLLAELGSDKRKLLSATIWLKDMADYAAMNRVWDGWVDPEHPPARCCCQALMAEPDILVEIIVVAALR